MPSEVVQLCQELVAIPSVNPQDCKNIKTPYGEKQIADFVYDWLGKYKLNPEGQEVLPGRENILATLEGADRNKTLLLCAHLDTVDIDAMTINAFDPNIKNGRLYGRGSCDTKGALAAMMLAFRDNAKKAKPQHNLVLLATCGEEYDKLGSMYYAKYSRDNLIGAVFGEPTELQVVTAHKGMTRQKLVCHGSSAHSSTPGLGNNAIYTMTKAILAIQGFADDLAKKRNHPMLGNETLVVTTIRGGREINVIPEQCQACIDWRILPGHNPAQCRDELAELLESEFDEGQIIIEQLNDCSPMDTNASDPLIIKLLKAAGRSETAVASFGTDASSFVDFGIPLAVFGPGNAEHAHAKDEYLEIKQLEKAQDCYKKFMEYE